MSLITFDWSQITYIGSPLVRSAAMTMSMMMLINIDRQLLGGLWGMLQLASCSSSVSSASATSTFFVNVDLMILKGS